MQLVSRNPLTTCQAMKSGWRQLPLQPLRLPQEREGGGAAPNEASYEEQQGQDPATLRCWPLMLPSKRREASKAAPTCGATSGVVGPAAARSWDPSCSCRQGARRRWPSGACHPPTMHGCHESTARCHAAAAAAWTFRPAGQPNLCDTH